ncbi:MAG: PilZ domain-containing protein [Thermoleophilia bacterium]
MTTGSREWSTTGVAPYPERGTRVLLDGLPGGPWSSVVESRADDLLTLAPPRDGGGIPSLPLNRPFAVTYSVGDVPCELEARLVAGPSPELRGYAARLGSTPRRALRRRAARVPVRMVASARLGDDGGAIAATTRDISVGGALLSAARAIEVGRALELEIPVDGEPPLRLGARVVRCDFEPSDGLDAWRVAMSFPDLDDEAMDRLNRLLLRLRRASPAATAAR